MTDEKQIEEPIEQTRDFLTEIATLTPAQMEAVEAMLKFPFVFYGGVAGPGKTRTSVAAMVFLSALYAAHGHRPAFALSSADKQLVAARFMAHINELVVRTGLGYVKGSTEKSPGGVFFHDKFGMGPIYFIGLRDVWKLRGIELAGMAIDEIPEVPEEDFHNIYWRLRFSGANNPLKHQPLLATGNPDGPYVDWVYQYFISREFDTPYGGEIKKYSDSFCFIPARLNDNPNSEFRERYKQLLIMLPDHLRRSRLEGVWEANLGARFPYDLEVIDPFTVPKHWHRYRCIDWGSIDPVACYWIAFNENGDAFVYREFYKSGMNIFDASEEIVSLSVYADGEPERIRLTAADETMFARESDGVSIADRAASKGLHLTPASNKHAHSNVTIEMFLQKNNGFPNIYFLRGACPTLLRDLRAVRFDKAGRNPENLVPHSATHSVYALGYGLHAARPATPKITNVDPEIKKRVDAYWRSRLKKNRSKLK